MEEFKVDKLGYYEKKSGKKMRMVHKIDYKSSPEFIFVNENNDECDNYNSDGVNLTEHTDNDRIIKYIGPELPKKPREFEFEGYIFEDKNGHIYDSDNQYALDKNFGYPVSPLCVLDESKHCSFNFRPGINRSKWKIHMTEILDE